MTKRLKFFSDRSEVDGYIQGLRDSNCAVMAPVEVWQINNIYMMVIDDSDGDVDGALEIDTRGSPSVSLELSTEGVKNLCRS
jgi:hypothetical protein